MRPASARCLATGVSSPKLCQKPSEMAGNVRPLRPHRRCGIRSSCRSGSGRYVCGDMCTNLPPRSARRHRAAAIGRACRPPTEHGGPFRQYVTATSSEVTKHQIAGTRRLGISAACPTGRGTRMYEPTWDSVSTHPLPTWYDDAKLGIFLHWGLY